MDFTFKSRAYEILVEYLAEMKPIKCLEVKLLWLYWFSNFEAICISKTIIFWDLSFLAYVLKGLLHIFCWF